MAVRRVSQTEVSGFLPKMMHDFGNVRPGSTGIVTCFLSLPLCQGLIGLAPVGSELNRGASARPLISLRNQQLLAISTRYGHDSEFRRRRQEPRQREPRLDNVRARVSNVKWRHYIVV